MHQKVRNHFEKHDPRLFEVLMKFDDTLLTPKKSDDYFVSLCEDIIGQQLGGKAADAITKRFHTLLGKNGVNPDAVLGHSDDAIRSIGTSWAKVRSLKDLAAKVKSREVRLDILSTFSDKDVLTELTKVKGIGPWTAEMFLMFSLGREDVFSYGDLGLKNAIIKIYGLKKDPSVKQIAKIEKTWRPYRTYACRILWASLDNR
ncbi:DNA-3-methyladenine glycosylase 2 family protein [Candidatus Gottesmanbacteria bacterium]|nr:DNA-3-methyladenine glycosylase 2 family protein [Candidatus Gottesmanbacteria bacterium]